MDDMVEVSRVLGKSPGGLALLGSRGLLFFLDLVRLLAERRISITDYPVLIHILIDICISSRRDKEDQEQPDKKSFHYFKSIIDRLACQ